MSAPSATDWLTAVGTVGTLAATVALFWIDRYQRQKRADSAQAAMISAWTEPVEAGDSVRELKIANQSDEPVYRVNVFLEDEDSQDSNHDILPKEIGSDTFNTKYVSVLPPKQQILFSIRRKNPESPGARTVPRAYLLFDDRNGKRWARDFRGGIHAKPTDDPENHRIRPPGSDLGSVIRSPTTSPSHPE